MVMIAGTRAIPVCALGGAICLGFICIEIGSRSLEGVLLETGVVLAGTVLRVRNSLRESDIGALQNSISTAFQHLRGYGNSRYTIRRWDLHWL